MRIGERMKQRRQELGLSAEQIADQLGVSAATVYRYEKGDIEKLPGNILEPLASALSTTPAFLMGWEEGQVLPLNTFSPKMKRVPILGGIACGEPKYAEEQYGEFAEVRTSINCDFALLANGDSMIEAGIKDGYVVFIHKQETVENGEIAAVILDDEATLKRVRRVAGGMTILEACNSKYDPILIGGKNETRNVKILGKAVAFQGYL